MVAFAVVVAVVLSYLLGLALGPRRLMRASAPPGRRSVENTDSGSGTSAQAVEVGPQAPADEAAMVETTIAVAQEAVSTPEAPRTRRRWLRRTLGGAICLAAIAAAILFAPRITGWDEVIFGAWIAAGVVVFLPLGAILRLARRVLRRLHAGRRATAVPAAADPAPVAAAVAPPPARRLLPPWAMRLSRAALGLALYAAFVSGAIYYTPDIMSQALGTEHPMASVTSGSMWPALKAGDLVILKGVDSAEELNVGDIIAFEHEGGFAIHRVIQVDGESITTQGDANRKPDEPITFDDVIGRIPKIAGWLVKIPYLGNVARVVGSNTDEPAGETPAAFQERGQAEQEPAEMPFDDSAGSQGGEDARSPADEEPTSRPSMRTIEYEVQPGDSLIDIAARFGTTVEALTQLNGLEEPNAILYGSTLTVSYIGEDAGGAPTGVSP